MTRLEFIRDVRKDTTFLNILEDIFNKEGEENLLLYIEEQGYTKDESCEINSVLQRYMNEK